MSVQEDAWAESGRLVRAFIQGFNQGGSSQPQPAKALPGAGIDAFLSHFVIAVQFADGDFAEALTVLTLPAAVQTVARSAPFTYRGPTAEHRVELPLPEGSKLPASISESDFLVRPDDLFETGRETVWLQILNIDARAETALGPVRIILGETFRREYEDVFQPSFGAVQTLGGGGFPARLFFSPNAIIETPLGTFKTRPKTLVGAKIEAFPPIGSAPTLRAAVPLDSVDAIRASGLAHAESLRPAASIVALAHPIDAALTQGGDPAFALVESTIAHT